MKKVIVVLAVFAFASFALAQEKSSVATVEVNAANVQTLAKMIGQREAEAKQVVKAINDLGFQLAHVNFTLEQLSETKELKRLFAAAEKAWEEEVSTQNQQAKIINQQNDKINSQDSQINDLLKRIESLEKGTEVE